MAKKREGNGNGNGRNGKVLGRPKKCDNEPGSKACKKQFKGGSLICQGCYAGP